MKRFLLLLIAITFVINGEALKVELFDGNTMYPSNISYRDGIFTFDGKTFKKDEVFSLRFSEKKKISIRKNAPAKDVFEQKELEENYYWIYDKALEMQKQYRDSSGLILLDKAQNILNEDGTTSYTYHFIGKILKEDKKGWADIAWGFEPGRTKINIKKARVIKNNKKYISFDPNSIKESTPSNSKSSISKNRKILSAVIPEVGIGDFVEYIIEREDYNPHNKDFFFPSFGFQSSEPVYRSEFKVVVPKNKTIYTASRNLEGFNIESKEYKENNKKVYEWKAMDVNPLISESYAPGYYEIAPNIKCSTLKSWKEFLQWEKKFLVERIVVTPEIKEKTLELTKGLKTKDEKLAKLYHWNQQEIRYLSIKSGIGSGWSGHKAQITLDNKFGDCIDKAILLSAMAKVIGVDVVPIGLLTNNSYKAEYGVPHFNNNHAIVKVYLDGKEFYLDATSEDYRYPYFRDDDHGVYVHNSMKDKIDFIPLPDIKDEAMHFLYYMDLQKDGSIDLLYTKRYSGSWEAGARGYWKRQREDRYEQLIRGDINAMKAGSNLKRFRFFNIHDISKPFYYFWEVNLKDYLIKAGDLFVMEMPWAEKGFSEISLEKRKYPLRYSSRQWVTSTYVLNLPDNFKVKYLPDNFAGWYKDIVFCNSSYSLKDNKVIYTVSHKRMKDRVYPEDYKGYKAFLESFVEATKQKLVLTNK